MLQLGSLLRSFRFASGLSATRFAACRETGVLGPEHALAEGATLCGIPRRRVTVYRHLFVARRSGRCPGCRTEAVRVMSERARVSTDGESR